MNHLILPPKARHYITVPYKCTEPYDNGDFYSYPERKGWTPNDIKGKNKYGNRNSKEIEMFFQSWLFFGVLVQVFRTVGIKIDIEDFINRDEGLVTTHHLPKLLEAYATAWKKTWPKNGDVSGLASTPKAVATTKILTKVFQTMHPFIHDSTVGGRPSIPSSALSPEIVVSIIGLATTFSEAGKFLYMRFEHNIPPGGTPLLRSILSKKWCPFQVTAMQIDLQLDAQYYLAALPGLPKNELRRHADCTHMHCREKPIDDKKYVLKHVIAGCTCRPVSMPIDNLIDTIKKGDTPIVSFHKGDGNQHTHLQVKGFNRSTASKLPYICISHVWSDGMGNPKHNALPACLLESIQKMVNDVKYYRRGPGHKHLHFWMDTLCIPVDPKHDEHRKKSIIKMRDIYHEASAVLVIESQLQTVRSTAPLLERCVNFYATKWVRRLWTYQEGILAKWLSFQFHDKSLELHDIYEASFNSYAPEHRQDTMISERRRRLAGQFSSQVMSQFGLASSALLHWQEDGKKDEMWGAFLPIVDCYSTRMTTRQSDEPLCLASAIRLDTKLLVEVKGPAGLKSENEEIKRRADRELADHRMAVLYRLVGKFNDFIIFSKFPRLPIEGFHWAPRTFLGERRWFHDKELDGNYDSGQPEPKYATIYTYKTDGKVERGLAVSFPIIKFDYPSNIPTDKFEYPSEFTNNVRKFLLNTFGIFDESNGVLGRYLVEPVHDSEKFSWTPGASYCLVMQRPSSKRVVGKSSLAVLGPLLQTNSKDKWRFRIRHQHLVRATLLSPQQYDTQNRKLEGKELGERNIAIV